MTLTKGARLGSYEVVGTLGAGGMGEVYLARDVKLGREVALKVVPSDLAADPDRLSRLQREARVVASLNHPNIVTLHAIEEWGGVSFLVMERVSGRTLSELVPHGGLSLRKILEIAAPVADALSAAHDRGIVHRDLKPANVMVTDLGLVKVLDFGLATVPSAGRPESADGMTTIELSADGQIAGTVPYMAPEQLRGERVDARTDLFAFGVMLYEMASGRRPFQGDSSADVASAILREEPKALTEVRPDLPPRLARLVGRCLEKDARRRIQSAIDLTHELQDLSDEIRSPSGLAPSSSEAPGRPYGTRWLAAAVIGAALVVVAVALLTKFIGSGRPPSGPAGRIASLAVLPFDNMTHDASQDYFVDGMHEALITDLARLGVVRVTSRNSVMRYKGQARSLKEVARELDVDAIIEGSVLRAGGQVRITAQLILGRTDEHLWANSYDRDLQDVLRLLSDVSRAIAEEVRVKVSGDATPGVPATQASRPRVRPEAFEAYLRGRAAIRQSATIKSATDAIRDFEQAIALDPTLAGAWSGLAMAWGMQAFLGGGRGPRDLAAASDAAEKAMTLDPDDGDAYGALGTITLYGKWNFEAARPLLERAVALSPHDSFLRHTYADYFFVTGRFDQSLEQVKLGRDFDPTSSMPEAIVLFHTMATRRFDDVIAEARRAMTLFPSLATQAHSSIGDALWRQRRFDEALAEYQQGFGDDPGSFKIFEAGYKSGGPGGALKAYADDLVRKANTGLPPMLIIAGLYAEAGLSDQAMQWLEMAYAAHLPRLLHLPADPAFDPIRTDPRFRDLLRRIGLSDAKRP